MNYKVGSKVSFVDFLGGIATGIITHKDADIKNGRPGFDMIFEDGETRWGYDYQIIFVHS